MCLFCVSVCTEADCCGRGLMFVSSFCSASSGARATPHRNSDGASTSGRLHKLHPRKHQLPRRHRPSEQLHPRCVSRGPNTQTCVSLRAAVCSDVTCVFFTETPPPGYISEDGETSDQQMNQSMETGRLDGCSLLCVLLSEHPV